MYNEGDRVIVTSWQLDLQRTEVLQGTVVEIGQGNDLIVEMDNGERRQFHTDEVQKIKQ